VDLASAARAARPDLGRNARRIARFLQTLDRHLLRRDARRTQPPAQRGRSA
jgi:hypothetical protein